MTRLFLKKLFKNVALLFPFATITLIRFEGYNLSPYIKAPLKSVTNLLPEREKTIFFNTFLPYLIYPTSFGIILGY